MARKAHARPLDTHDVFPSVELTLTSGERLTLPSRLTPSYNRGAFCPPCNAHLRAFQSNPSTPIEDGVVLGLTAGHVGVLVDQAKTFLVECLERERP